MLHNHSPLFAVISARSFHALCQRRQKRPSTCRRAQADHAGEHEVVERNLKILMRGHTHLVIAVNQNVRAGQRLDTAGPTNALIPHRGVVDVEAGRLILVPRLAAKCI